MTVCDGCPCSSGGSFPSCGLGYEMEYAKDLYSHVSYNCRLIKVETIDSAFYPDKRMGGEYEETDE